MNITQVLVGQSPTLTLTTYTDGTATDQGTFTIGIVDANGGEVVAAGTAVTDGSNGTYTYVLAAQTDPAFLTVTWTETGGTTYTTYVDVVGAVLFTESALRGFDDQQMSTTNLNPSDTAIAETRQRVTERLEYETGRSWIPRYCRAVLPGTGSTVVSLDDAYPRDANGTRMHRPGSGRDVSEILSCTIDGAAASPTLLDDGCIYLASGFPRNTTSPLNVTVEFVYGLPYPVDGVDRIAMMVAAHQLKSSRIPAGANSFSDPLGTYQMDPTRLPHEAWAWIQSHRVGAPFA